jgi:hypothetical protein
LEVRVIETRKVLSFGTRASQHPVHHEPPSMYILESGAMDGGRKARSASDGDEKGP